MNPSTIPYHLWVEWSEEDQSFLGLCPDLISGIHGEDPDRLHAELRALVLETMADLVARGQPLPPARTRPVRLESVA